jgi:hypothetical protein
MVIFYSNYENVFNMYMFETKIKKIENNATVKSAAS